MKSKLKIKMFFVGVVVVTLMSPVSFAQDAFDEQAKSIISAFRYYKSVDNITIKVPTVLEILFAEDFLERVDFAIADVTSGKAIIPFEPYFSSRKEISIPVSMDTGSSSGDTHINDGDTQTYAEFLLPDNAQGRAQIVMSSEEPVTSSAITAVLDNNVALPSRVEIRADVNGQDRIVVASKRMDGQTIYFPKTTSSRWTVVFNFDQPLRISELRLHPENIANISRSIRFLAQPQHSYRVYFDPDRYVKVPVGELGDLRSTPIKDVLVMPIVASQNNTAYIIADVDSDGLPDTKDNCVLVSNKDQQDVDNNGRGDVCDDFDKDGLINSKDNCSNNPNRYQEDADSDGIGDVCDREESRITERYSWIPWVGIGFAGLVIVVLFISVAKSSKAKE